MILSADSLKISHTTCQTVESALIYPNNVLLSARVLLVFSQLF